MADLHLWTDGAEFIIAKSPEDAVDIMREMGVTPEADAAGHFDLYPDDKPFTYFDADYTTKPAREWVAERGRGHFAYADY